MIRETVHCDLKDCETHQVCPLDGGLPRGWVVATWGRETSHFCNPNHMIMHFAGYDPPTRVPMIDGPGGPDDH